MGQVRLTEEEFEENRVFTGALSMNTLNVAYQVLVEGKSKSKVAEEYGWSRQRVHAMVRRYFNAVQRVPSNWEQVTVWLPPEDAKKVRALERQRNSELPKG